MQGFILSDNWQFKQRAPGVPILDDLGDIAEWMPASVPGTVHQDLLAVGRIPDPFIGLNENAVQWVGETDWLYRCTFHVAPTDLDARQLDLCFDGLDTFATVWLNGECILVNDNMFVPARIPVKQTLRAGENTLSILFESALRRGQEREALYGKLRVWNGDSSRVYVRKAQYHYGWDWGPTLLTAGAWRPIRLEAYTGRIADVAVPIEVSADLTQATLSVQITVEGRGTVQLSLYGPAGQLVDQAEIATAGEQLQHVFTLQQPELWYPRGYGDQLRYRLAVTLSDETGEQNRRELLLGVRRLRLVQEPLLTEAGTSFYFEVNNLAIFCGGANWIPGDNLLPRISDGQYRRWLQAAADANMTMLRVWGGGIYEADIFYDLCDELGLMVWQDFLFGCGIYPALDWFQASVRVETEMTVRRLRHHACLALWSGNNEDYAIAESIGAYDPDFNGDFSVTAFPARAIYERLLPEVCAALDPTRSYWPGSPYGGKKTSDQTVGDRHTWEIWHNPMADYHDYPRYAARFISEFGMESMPDMATIEAFTTPADRYAESRVLDHHNKSTEGPQRLAWYLAANLRTVVSLPEYVYNTQFVQSEALANAIDGWRRRWGMRGNRLTAGALIWQLNDCWPVASWALIDSFLRRKPAYYRVKRSFALVSLGMAAVHDQVDIWAVNSGQSQLNAELNLQVWTLAGTSIHSETRPVALAPNAAAELGSLAIKIPADQDSVVSARLLHEGAVIARAVRWPEPPKYFDYSDPELKLTPLTDGKLSLQVARPARGVYLTAPDGTQWTDNMLDLLPGDPQVITLSNLPGADHEIEQAAEILVNCVGCVGQRFQIALPSTSA